MVRFSIRFASIWLSLTSAVQAEVCNWQGGDSVWSTPANWSCAAQPGTSDQAVLASNNNLTLDVTASIQSFTLNSNNAVLLGPQSLTSINTFDLQAGTVNSILAGSAGANKTNAGTVTWNETLEQPRLMAAFNYR